MAPKLKCECGTCEICKKLAYQREWRARNPDKHKAYSRKWREQNPDSAKKTSVGYHERNLEAERKRKRDYYHQTDGRLKQRLKQGILDAHLTDEVLAAQGQVCGICGASEAGGYSKGWHADHEHGPDGVGLLRGVLCDKCNRGLGFFNDGPELLLAAVYYLANPPAQRVRDRQK